MSRLQVTINTQPLAWCSAASARRQARRGAHHSAVAAQAVKTRRRPTQQGESLQTRTGTCQYIEVQPDGSDAWRLGAVADMINEGKVGIVPTDSYPALVCDLGSSEATQRLAAIKQVSLKKPLSILVKGFADVEEYTLGWPPPTEPGQPDTFAVVRQLLPGPYTFILNASKNMPKVVLPIAKAKQKKKSKQRATVGVRMPDQAVCQELLQSLERPLLCTSVHAADDGIDVYDAMSLMDKHPDIDFIVDHGFGAAQPSTIVDMTVAPPEVIRQGGGDATPFL